jgi:Zn-dependent M28 family amino/carboxypeptidase
VVACIPGKTKKRIVFSAHIDHLGMDEARAGDRVFNGALDNGTAVASMLVTAKILKEFEKDLYYSVTFLACNAEEALMLGSKYYVQHTDREEIVANINFESTPVWERAASIMAVGARFSTLEDMVRTVAAKQGVGYSRFSMSNQGFFYRSDQYSFARYGIPAIWISAGEDDASGQKKYNRFWRQFYHTVDDEYDPAWPLSAMKQSIGAALLLTDYLNKHRAVPVWKGNLTFPLETVFD